MGDNMSELESKDTDTKDKFNYSFEEFRLMYQSTELVSDRKINFTRANSSLCMAIIAGQGIGASWAYQKADVEPIAAVTILIVSLLGIVFCLYWNGQLWAFKDLNSAKFKVLEEMAGRVVFPDYKDLAIRSMNPFFREYQILDDAKKLARARGNKAQRANFAETIVPKSFLAFFVITAVLCAVWFLQSIGVIPTPGK